MRGLRVSLARVSVVCVSVVCVSVVCVSLALCAPAHAEDDPRPADEPAVVEVDSKTLVKQLGSSENPERLAAAEAAKDRQDARLVLPLVKLLRDDLYDVRKAAREALTARTAKADKKKAAQGLARELDRLVKDPQSAGELVAIIGALHDLAQPVSIDPLLDFLKHDTDAKIVEPALMAVANVPDKAAIKALIDFAAARGRRNSGHRRAATNALRYATGERLGNDPDEWRAWWKTNEKSFDHEYAVARRAEEKAKSEKKAQRRRDREDREDGDDGGKRRRPPRDGK